MHAIVEIVMVLGLLVLIIAAVVLLLGLFAVALLCIPVAIIAVCVFGPLFLLAKWMFPTSKKTKESKNVSEQA